MPVSPVMRTVMLLVATRRVVRRISSIDSDAHTNPRSAPSGTVTGLNSALLLATDVPTEPSSFDPFGPVDMSLTCAASHQLGIARRISLPISLG